jgi:hypothetical protein
MTINRRHLFATVGYGVLLPPAAEPSLLTALTDAFHLFINRAILGIDLRIARHGLAVE